MHIPEHFLLQLFCGVGSQAASLWKHIPVEEVHFPQCHRHRCVQGKPEKGKTALVSEFNLSAVLCDVHMNAQRPISDARLSDLLKGCKKQFRPYIELPSFLKIPRTLQIRIFLKQIYNMFPLFLETAPK